MRVLHSWLEVQKALRTFTLGCNRVHLNIIQGLIQGYTGYILRGKIFVEPRSIVLQKIFAEANFQNSFIDIHQSQT